MLDDVVDEVFVVDSDGDGASDCLTWYSPLPAAGAVSGEQVSHEQVRDFDADALKRITLRMADFTCNYKNNLVS